MTASPTSETATDKARRWVFWHLHVYLHTVDLSAPTPTCSCGSAFDFEVGA